jgi:hypothetical protein
MYVRGLAGACGLIPLKFLNSGRTCAESGIYLSGDEVISDMGVEVCSFGFRCQKFFIVLWWDMQILVEEAGAEFDFEQALLQQIEGGSQYGRLQRHAGHYLQHQR